MSGAWKVPLLETSVGCPHNFFRYVRASKGDFFSPLSNLKIATYGEEKRK
jgi:hypothetical protein